MFKGEYRRTRGFYLIAAVFTARLKQGRIYDNQCYSWENFLTALVIDHNIGLPRFSVTSYLTYRWLHMSRILAINRRQTLCLTCNLLPTINPTAYIMFEKLNSLHQEFTYFISK